MARFAAGDDAAGTPLAAQVAPGIRAFFLRSFAEPTIAEALTETTLERLGRLRASYQSTQSTTSFKTWLFGIAAGVRREELQRRYGLEGNVGEAELLQAESRQARPARAPDAPAGPASGAEAARGAIARLPESQRVILHLYGQEGFTFEQIAEVLGTTPEAVRSRASAAYQRLQVELQAYLRPNGQ